MLQILSISLSLMCLVGATNYRSVGGDPVSLPLLPDYRLEAPLYLLVGIMSDADDKLHHVASIHATLTALSVAVGRLEEQMKNVRDDLKYHTNHEHQSFNSALRVVEEIKGDVNKLQGLVDQGKGAQWALAKIGGLVVLAGSAFAWVFIQFFRR